jgi:hypothetical protein
MMSPSDELLALSSVEMRRRIGTKECIRTALERPEGGRDVLGAPPPQFV